MGWVWDFIKAVPVAEMFHKGTSLREENGVYWLSGVKMIKTVSIAPGLEEPSGSSLVLICGFCGTVLHPLDTMLVHHWVTSSTLSGPPNSTNSYTWFQGERNMK